jgi:hypothetical protein
MNSFSQATTQEPVKKPWWEGSVEGITVAIGPDDIQITSIQGSKDITLSFKKNFDEDSKKLFTDVESGTDRSETYIPLSFVGPFLSLRLHSTLYFAGTFHPTAIASFVTCDIRDIKKTAALTDFFEEKVLLKALMADKVVARHIPKKNKILTLKELLGVLSKAMTPCEYAFGEDMLKSFAFHSTKRDQVAVRIALSHGCLEARGTTTELGLLLPTPDSLKMPLTLAASGESGFLMEKAKKMFRNKSVSFYAEKP